jgi:uncharacterized membrane protein
MDKMITVTLYTKTGCHLCEQAEADLKALQEVIPHKLVKIDIDTDPVLISAYALEIPVVEVGPYKLKAPFTRQDLEMTIGAANDRKAHLERLDDKSYQAAVERGQTVTGADKFSYWLAKHYMLVINLFLLLYVGLPFLAPTFKKIGWNGPAEVIYKVYSPLCHQWGFRSFYLFGKQAYYPHAAAKIPDAITFEAATGITDQNDPARLQARQFEGNPVLGFKIAICERDIAIWGAMLLFGLIFAVTGRRLPPLHWLIWFIVGVLPIGLDGFSQLFSQIPSNFIQSILPYRESTPFLRVLTGFLFGFTTAWFGFPVIEEAMADTRRLLAKKFAVNKS